MWVHQGYPEDRLSPADKAQGVRTTRKNPMNEKIEKKAISQCYFRM